MIITVTPNPSIDRTQSLDGPLVPGEVNRTVTDDVQAGGKGVNVATVCHTAGEDVVAVVPAADSSDFAALVRSSGVPAQFVGDAPVRTNITLTDGDGVTTKINSPGPTGTDGTDLTGALVTLLRGHESPDAGGPAPWVVLAGSLPPGYPEDWYARTTATAHELGYRVAVDTSGPALRALVDSAHHNPASAPDVIKPNAHELAEITGGDGAVLEDDAADGNLRPVVDAARSLVDTGFGAAMVSLGAAGAVLVDADGAWYCPSPRVRAVSTVGAGDSSLAGYVLAAVRGGSSPERLGTAVAHGSAAVTLPGTTLPTPGDLPADTPTVRPVDDTPGA
ncbi:1-phosphofructokinase family hexose kinase [Corynebacterium bovis]|uniref:1-phosphofructokinase family hexose kinase n=2 Tax=Corynebacterium bovis TaxID=36808 RepID=UPI0031390BA8